MLKSTSPASGRTASARPALSAARGIDIIDLLASFPDRAFTLSQIMRATGINVASCHAVLGALASRGYIQRDPQHKTFTLGPVIAALGEAAIRAQPLLARARRAAQLLAADCDVPVLLTAPVGDEIVCIAAIANAAGRAPSLKAAERRPFVPPIGAPFVAWAPATVIAEWLARNEQAEDPDFARAMTEAAALIRARGFQVTLREAGKPRLAPEIDDMARAGGYGSGFRQALTGKVRAMGAIAMPATIAADGSYDVILIAAPIFDRDGACAFNLCLGDFTEPMAGAVILALADRLLAACLQVMQADRA